MMLYEALDKSMNHDHTDELLKDLAKARKKKKKRRDSPKTPPGSPPYQLPPPPPPPGPSGTSRSLGASGSSQVPPPPPPPLFINQEGQLHGSTAPSSSKTAASAKYKAWTRTDTRLKPSVSLITEDLHMDDDMALDAQVHSSDDEDIENAHISKVNLQKDWWKPLKEDRPATPEPALFIPSSNLPVLKNNWASALASTYSPPPEDSLLAQTGDMAMFMDWFCKSKGITELKPQDLEGPAFELVKVFNPNMWIKEECKYDIVAIYGISHWWFQRQQFYINRHTSEGDHRAVKTHMRILSVVRIEVFSMYGYDYMKKIVLRRADLNEHIIAERDFKYLYLSDFKDSYLLNLQGYLNHLPPKDKKILTIAVNLWTRDLVIRQRMIIRFNEIHKFSDGTLHQIDEALDYRVKEFKVNRINPGLNTRFWTRKDVDRSKDVMFAIQKWLKTTRIFHNLESFVGGRVAVCSSLRSLKPKRTIESRAKRSSKIISLGHYSIMLASSHTVKSKTDIKSPTHYPRDRIYIDQRGTVVLATLFNESEQIHFRPFITNVYSAGIPTVAAAGQKDVNSQLHAHTSNSLSMT
nr:hypothetical protein [Tanacetum cinerariifolium]